VKMRFSPMLLTRRGNGPYATQMGTPGAWRRQEARAGIAERPVLTMTSSQEARHGYDSLGLGVAVYLALATVSLAPTALAILIPVKFDDAPFSPDESDFTENAKLRLRRHYARLRDSLRT